MNNASWFKKMMSQFMNFLFNTFNVCNKFLLLLMWGFLSLTTNDATYAQVSESVNFNIYIIEKNQLLPVRYNEIDMFQSGFQHMQDTLNEDNLVVYVEFDSLQNYQFAFKINDWNWSKKTPVNHFLFEINSLNIYELGVRVFHPSGKHLETYFFSGNFSQNKKVKKYHFIMLLLGIALLVVLFFFHRFYRKRDHLENVLNEKTNELLAEREKTEKFLSNLLPKVTADELRAKGRADSKKYEMATVLFCDIQGFTKIAEEMNPEILVDKLDSFFFHFDAVVDKLNIEKIKTIGDAYMCAGGIPKKNTTNPVEVVLAALEMMDYMLNLQDVNKIWELRIGVHTGSLIAGVVGQKRLSYDIWGDTVNTASRMESSGEAGKINISGQTYRLVKDYFICEYRGKMPVKYKGKIDMYFVKGIRPGLSEENIYKPNKTFLIKLQFLKLNDLEAEVYIIMELFQDLNLPYHNLKHTMDVYTKSELYAHAENLKDEEILMVKTAALLYDLYVIDAYQYVDNESHKVSYLLTEFKYSEKQKEIVFGLFMRLNKPLLPQSDMEKVFVDAEYDYFGRLDFKFMIKNRFDEINMHHPVKDSVNTKKEFLEMFEIYDFHTNTARKLREVEKNRQLSVLKEFFSEVHE